MGPGMQSHWLCQLLKQSTFLIVKCSIFAARYLAALALFFSFIKCPGIPWTTLMRLLPNAASLEFCTPFISRRIWCRNCCTSLGLVFISEYLKSGSTTLSLFRVLYFCACRFSSPALFNSALVGLLIRFQLSPLLLLELTPPFYRH